MADVMDTPNTIVPGQRIPHNCECGQEAKYGRDKWYCLDCWTKSELWKLPNQPTT